MIRKIFNKKEKNSLAQGLVEFALVFPIFLLLLFGLIEFSRLMFIYIAVTASSREAVRYGSAVGDNGFGTPRYMDCDGIRSSAITISQFAGIVGDDIDVRYIVDDIGTTIDCSVLNEWDIDWGDRIQVTVSGTFTVGDIIPFVEFPPIQIDSIAHRTIMKGALVVKEDSAEIATPDPSSKAPILQQDPEPQNTLAGKCNDIEFVWKKHGGWLGEDDNYTYYFQEFGQAWETVVSTVNPTVFSSSYSLNNGASAFYRVYADLGDGDFSDKLTFTLSCFDGILTKDGT